LKRALITGASGFVGIHLINHLLDLGWDVSSYDQRAPAKKGIPYFIGDLSRGEGLLDAVNEFRPDFIFHLAGVLKSESPETFYNVHVLGMLALFEAIIKSELSPSVVVVSSSAVYGAIGGTTPLSEDFALQPITHYATSKLAQEMVALRYCRSSKLRIMCMRTFNLLGPGLSPDMAPSAFAEQIARAEKAGAPAKIFTGDLSAQRDYVDVRDAVRAYTLIAEHGKTGQIYNVCSGRAISMSEILQILLDQAQVQIEAALDSARVQKQDVPVQIGSAEKIQQLTGWNAEINIRKSLTDLLNDWREKINLENVK
jgi:GDP-4-dehydro-6-deoxy-D-mannose reductase